MDEDKKINVVKIAILIIFLGFPVLVMFYNIPAGGFLLVSGLFGTARAFRFIGSHHLQYDKTAQLHNANAAGKTILVQIVDDFGRELPPEEVKKRLAEATSKADPKDSIVPVKFKVPNK